MKNGTGFGLAALRLCLGVFFLFMGLGKIGWLASSAALRSQLEGWAASAPAVSRAYLDAVALPGVELFARAVPIGELAVGAAFIIGGYTRLAATMGLLMILNFHFASGIIFTFGYLTNGFGLPVVGGLFALALGGASLPLSMTKK
jgi:thiosulfate dehydrogenase (quinone) large subunit